MEKDVIENLTSDFKPFDDGNLFVNQYGKVYRKNRKGNYVELKPVNLGKEKGLRICYTRLDGKNRNKLLHPIVAELFCKKDGNERTVGAKDGDFTNVNCANLYWKENREERRRKSRILKSSLEIDKLTNDYIKVSNLNAYINAKGNVFKKNSNNKFVSCKKYLKSTNNTSAYYVNIYNYENQKNRTIGVHTLLGYAFLPNNNPEKNKIVWFKDNDGLNIDLNNLYWTSKVNPIALRKEVLERTCKFINEEYKDMGKYVVTIKGNVYFKNGNDFVLLKHYDQFGNIVVHIPTGNSKYSTRKVAQLMGEAFVKKDRLLSKEIYFRDNNRKNIELANLYRKELLYPTPRLKIDNGVEYLPDGFVQCKNINDYYINENATIYKKIENKFYKIEAKEYSGKQKRMAFSFKSHNKWITIGLASVMANTFLNRSGRQQVGFKDGDFHNCVLNNLYLRNSTISNINANIFIDENNEFKDAAFDEGICLTTDGRIAYRICENKLKLINVHSKQNGTKYFLYVKNGKTYKRYLSKVLGQTFLDFPKVCNVLFKNNNKEDTSLDNLLYSEKIPFARISEPAEYIDFLGPEFKECKYDEGIFINRGGEVYQSYFGKYKKLKHITFKSKKYIYVSYVKNRKNYNRIVSRLLMETFYGMELNQMVIHLDGNYHNLELSNLKIADRKVNNSINKTIVLDSSYKECPYDENVFIKRNGEVAIKLKNGIAKQINWHDYNGKYYVFINRKKKSIFKLLAQTYLGIDKNKNVGCFDNDFHNVSIDNIKVYSNSRNGNKINYEFLPEGYIECRNDHDLFINKDGNVLYKNGNNYSLTKKSLIKRKTGENIYVYYPPQRKRLLSKLLVENFINRTDKITVVSYKDGNHSNLSLDNLTYNVFDYYQNRKKAVSVNGKENISIDFYGEEIAANIDNYVKVKGFHDLYVSKNGDVIVIKNRKAFRAMLIESSLYKKPCMKIKLSNNQSIYLPLTMLSVFSDINEFKGKIIRYKDSNYHNCSIDNLEIFDKNDYMMNDIPCDCVEMKKDIFVSKNGDFYIYKDGRYYKKDIKFGMIDTGTNLLVCAKEINTTFSAKKMVAEAFVENPNKYKYIYYKDCNYHNICADNLYWTNTVEKRKYLVCVKCGNTYTKIGKEDGWCPRCIRARDKSLITKSVDPLLPKLEEKGIKLTNKQKEYAELYDQGKNTQQIADILGVSRQAVSFTILNIKNKLDLDHKQSKKSYKKIGIDRFNNYGFSNISYEEYCAIYERVKNVASNSPVIITKKVAQIINDEKLGNNDLDKLIFEMDKKLEFSRNKRNKNTKEYPYAKYLSLKLQNLRFDEYILILDECSHYDIDKYKLAKVVCKKIDLLGFDNSNIEYEVKSNYLIMSNK